ncbi:unnamed protein product [Prorocentrum cordatum]|uniref:Expansin-like EG45 domain-containing protein n=1 Tax=Prorocentrum cordatum TaxID=2364126 RepID=A0ABN9QWH0_9DINO|nr:unnamed protein product [Polarella glacialis]
MARVLLLLTLAAYALGTRHEINLAGAGGSSRTGGSDKLGSHSLLSKDNVTLGSDSNGSDASGVRSLLNKRLSRDFSSCMKVEDVPKNFWHTRTFGYICDDRGDGCTNVYFDKNKNTGMYIARVSDNCCGWGGADVNIGGEFQATDKVKLTGRCGSCTAGFNEGSAYTYSKLENAAVVRC